MAQSSEYKRLSKHISSPENEKWRNEDNELPVTIDKVRSSEQFKNEKKEKIKIETKNTRMSFIDDDIKERRTKDQPEHKKMYTNCQNSDGKSYDWKNEKETTFAEKNGNDVNDIFHEYESNECKYECVKLDLSSF